MIKSIVFDVDGVLTFASFSEVYQEIATKIGVDPVQLDKLHMSHLKDLLLGKISGEQMAQLIEEHFGLSVKFSDIFQEIYLNSVSLNDELLSKIKHWKETYHLGILSNASPYRITADNTLKLYEDFSHLVISCDIGLKKANEDIFSFYLNKTGFCAEECVFIDDKEKNTKAAKELGFNVIHYKNNNQLYEELQSLGVNLK